MCAHTGTNTVSAAAALNRFGLVTRRPEDAYGI